VSSNDRRFPFTVRSSSISRWKRGERAGGSLVGRSTCRRATTSTSPPSRSCWHSLPPASKRSPAARRCGDANSRPTTTQIHERQRDDSTEDLYDDPARGDNRLAGNGHVSADQLHDPAANDDEQDPVSRRTRSDWSPELVLRVLRLLGNGLLSSE